MQRTFLTIRAALRASSATLVLASAGCAETERATDGGPSDPLDRLDAATMMDARVENDARVDNDARVELDALVRDDGSIMLAAFPMEALTCSGPDHSADDDAGFTGGYFGRCCAEAMCYTPEPNAACLPAAMAQQEHFSFGSGDCNCGPVEGPFAPPDDAAAPLGECCYVVPVITCTGRPLSTDRGHLLATVISSFDWIA